MKYSNYRKSTTDKISSLKSSAELNSLDHLHDPFMKDPSIRSLDITPDLIERMLKEILKGSIESLTTEVEKVIWNSA